MAADSFFRFEDPSGAVHYAALPKDGIISGLIGETVDILEGHPFRGLESSGQQGVVAQVLCPLESVPAILAIGINYKQHANEVGLTVPPYPVLFTKAAGALAGPNEDIPIHPSAQSLLDYEGELVVVIGADAKNVSEEEALSYVLGYTIGNDISARNFQLPDVSGGQFCYAKSFDKFAPIGPAIITPKTIPDPQALRFTTTVNGEKRQDTSTDNMIWTVKQIIHHLSRGTTLKQGTIIMTGTPSGVGFAFPEKKALQNGDIVEIELEGFGEIRNKIVFESA